MAEIAVSAAKVLVETVLHALSQMQKTVHDEVKGLGFCLHRLVAYLADMEGNEGSEQLRERVKELRDVAFHIEDVLEEFMFLCSTSGLKPDHQLAPNIPGDEETVGFEECEEAIILQLTDQELRDVTISVVGPGGSGKTTIVNKVYENKRIWSQFDCRAWVQVSQSFNIEELFCSMLKQFCESREEPIPSGGINTQAKLRHYLQQKSYTDLPTYLKSCFLYFCIFPEDYSIDCGTLVRLWIAEGFVSRKGGKTLEEVVEYYLNELIERNLVHARRLDFVGQARYCRVLNLVHEFINRKSEEVNFFSQIRELDASSNKNVQRISIDNGCINLAQIRGLNYVRSAFLFKKSNLSTSAIEHVLCAFKLMRVLDLRDAPLDKFPEVILLLYLLRYPCLRNTKIKEIPNSIKKLSHLETLDLKQTKVTILPEGILQLHNLRHLLIYWYNIKNYVTWHSVVRVKIARGISALTNLQKLSLIKSDKHHEIVKELKALTQLRKLGLVDLKREGGKYLCASVEKMALGRPFNT
ncbi:disease resistance protein RPM1-like [Rhododendron vialii]|uniref:disease resistance protein RPM1-like n=1 Tax=Rhododendron vialii TaxID=182163 RepID=UPI00265F4EE2|nr:disease resistance protein RPM1-like [Rhododendron vialii]